MRRMREPGSNVTQVNELSPQKQFLRIATTDAGMRHERSPEGFWTI
jgi:hypothetical protein